MIIINNKAYYTEREGLDARLFLDKIQANYISLWDKWYKNIPESQTYDYTEIDAWYKTHPDNYTGKWEEWYKKRPAIPTDLTTDSLEGWSAWEKKHPKFPDESVIKNYGKVKKIYVDYPAHVQTKDEIVSAEPIDDRLLKGLWYDAYSHISDSRDFSGTSDWALPTDNVKIHYLNGDSDGPKSHRALVYPDENYFDIHQNTVIPWLDWLDTNAETIIKRAVSNETIRGDDYETMVIIYARGLRSLISDLKINENLDQYRYGILYMQDPEHKSDAPAPFPIIALYSGDYIKRSKYLEPVHLSDNWIDYTLCKADGGVDGYYPAYYRMGVCPISSGLTFGFLDAITEKDFINKRLAIIAIAPVNFTFDVIPYQNPDDAFLKYEAENKSFGIKKISNSAYTWPSYMWASPWNNYTILNLPSSTVALKDDDEHLYNRYSFGENIKYKKRFIPSPVLKFHRLTGYCSHAIRYNEGVLPGSPTIIIKR